MKTDNVRLWVYRQLLHQSEIKVKKGGGILIRGTKRYFSTSVLAAPA